MAIITPTFEGIVNSFIDNLRAVIPEASTTSISTLRESMINPTSTQLSALYDVAQRISVLQNIFEAVGTDLDNLAVTYKITRKGGTPSSGILTLDLSALLTRDQIIATAGTLVRTSGGGPTGTTFSIVSTTTFAAVDRATFEAAAASIRSELDSIGLTSVTLVGTVPIVSTASGSSTRVGAFTLNNAAIPNVSRVINITAADGGTDPETDDALRRRVVAVFTGNSVGTEASLLSAALATSGITSGFSVRSGDPLMTRDGSVFDEDGNLIQAGTGRAIDIYVQGTSLVTNTERQQFTIKDSSHFLSVANSVLLGQPSTGNPFGFLPVFSVTGISGDESGAAFAQGSPVVDEEGNVLIEGNFALIKDVEANKYSIVENLVTRERKLAQFVSPTTTKYTVVEQFKTSQSANSPFSQDRVVFLANQVGVAGESVTRGKYNGADQLRFANVTQIDSVSEQLTISETIKVANLVEVPGGIAIQVKNTPVVSVTSVINTRLGTTYTTEVVNAATGIIKLVGRTHPRTGDFLRVDYIWENVYKEDLNYVLEGDLVDWVSFADERGTIDATILPSESLETANVLAIQPNIPSRMKVTVGGMSDREIIQTQLQGTIVNFFDQQLTLKSNDPYRFAITGLTNIGRLFKVTNVTKGFDYNLAGYQLKTNKFDPTIRVDSSLLTQQFQLNARTNGDLLLPGDKILLGRPSQTVAFSSQADFENNVQSNLAPIFDPTKLDFTSGGIILKTPLLDTTSPVTTLSGLITQDLTLSGIVEITDDLIIKEGVVLSIEPSTVVKIRPSDQLESQLSFTQKVFFDTSLVQAATVGIPVLPYQEFLYLFFQPANFASSFFTIINDEGQTLSIRFGQDIITKTVAGSEIIFYANGIRVPATFNAELESTIDLDDVTTSLKATLLGARTGVDGEVEFISARIPAQEKYFVILERTPVVSSSLLTDFTLAVEDDPTLVFERFSYNSDINALEVEGDILSIDGYGTSSTTTILAVNGNDVELDSVVGVAVGNTLRQNTPDPDPTQPDNVVFGTILVVNTLTNTVTTTPSSATSADSTNTVFVPGSALITEGSADPTHYTLSYFIEESRRISIIVEGTLLVQGASSDTSVLFTSSGGSNSKPGDWEGIVFTAKSHSLNSTTLFQSDLNNARIRFANTGVSIQASDVNVQSCIVRDCIDVGINITSGSRARAQFTQAGFTLTFAAFTPVERVGFTTEDSVQLARYTIPDNMITSLANLPTLGQKLSDTSYIVELADGIDVKVYIDQQRAISIDTSQPADGIADHALVPGSDFMIEFDINTGYSLVFLYTLSPKLRNVYDLIVDLASKTLPGVITIDFFAAIPNGVIFNNLITTTTTGIVLGSLATCSINANTIDGNRIGISSQGSIVNIRNNLITGFVTAGIVSDSISLLKAQRNDIYSSFVVEANRNGVADTDILLKSIDALAISLLVRTPAKYRVGMIIRIDSEDMLVQGATVDGIIVARGQNNTTFSAHSSGAQISIFQLNQIFTVTGIDGDFCSLIETDSFGIQAAASVPIEMRALASNTFRAVFPINRRADFYYRYRYGTRGDPVVRETEVKVFLRNQFGVGVNDIISIFHEIPLTLVQFTPNMENYSADPLYNNIAASDYSFISLTSLASKQNPVYGSLVVPNPLHRYVGFLEVRLNVTLEVGATRVPVFSEPLIVSSLIEEVSIIGIDTNNAGILLLPSSFSFSVTPTEADQGATGVFILSTPITLSQAGTYQVQYRRPINLGTSLPPYYIQADISYVLDLGSLVVFDTLTFSKDAIGGKIEFTFQAATSINSLSAAPVSIVSDVSPIDIAEVGTDTGQAIQINIRLLGNDSSYTPELIYQFPILEDFSLAITPAKDSQQYKILSLIYNTIQNVTNILIDRPISSDTYSIVGIDPVVEVFVRKKADNFAPSAEFIISTAEGVSVGDTFVRAKGNLLVRRPDADAGDILRVDYMAYTTGQETLYFVANGPQITGNLYGDVSSITSTFTKDTKSVLPTTETVSIESVTQPSPGRTYAASYSFEAPLDGEILNLNYAYNQLIRTASQNLEKKKSLNTDAQVRQVTTINVTIAGSLSVLTSAKPLAVQTAVANAIAQLFAEFVDVTVERRLDPSDITRALGAVAGIEDFVVTTLSRDGIIGEVKTLIFERRESPVLAPGSPRINTSQNGRPILIGSS